VADPDGLLLEEGILEGVRKRGFEMIPFEDHIAFRYAYESKFRSRGDRGEQKAATAGRYCRKYVALCGLSESNSLLTRTFSDTTDEAIKASTTNCEGRM
jgi:hypothetical protein